jgi:hypothetical protein
VLPDGMRRMVLAAARIHPRRVTWRELAALSRLSPDSGTYSKYRAEARSLGLLEEDGNKRVGLTDYGKEQANIGASSKPLTSEELIRMWRDTLPDGAQRMFDVFVEHPDDTFTWQEVATAANLTPGSGTTSKYRSMLRDSNLVVVRGKEVQLNPALLIQPEEDQR